MRGSSRRERFADALSRSPAAKMAEERSLHESKLQKMEAEMKMVFQQKVNEKEAKLKQSEEELYARHREMKEALEKQRLELEDKKRRLESGRPLTPEKVRSSPFLPSFVVVGADRTRRRRRRASSEDPNHPPLSSFLKLLPRRRAHEPPIYLWLFQYSLPLHPLRNPRTSPLSCPTPLFGSSLNSTHVISFFAGSSQSVRGGGEVLLDRRARWAGSGRQLLATFTRLSLRCGWSLEHGLCGLDDRNQTEMRELHRTASERV